MKEISLEPLSKIATSPWIFKTVVAAIELEIFTKIAEGKNIVDEISNSIGAKKGIDKLLNACVALGLLEKDKEKYRNTPLADKFLVKGKPEYYGDFILMINSSSMGNWDKLKDTILTGVPKHKNVEHVTEPIFTRAMHNNAIGPANVLSEKIDFSKHSNLLDLGGGSGAYSIILTNKYPNLRSTVFELPKVCETADKFIQELGDIERVKTLPGDFLKDELPKGSDVVLLSQILHSFGPETNKNLLKKAYNILPENGLIIINEFLLNEKKTGPLFPALFSVNMLTVSEDGSAYTESEVKNWLEEAGFKNLETKHLTGPHTAIVGVK